MSCVSKTPFKLMLAMLPLCPRFPVVVAGWFKTQTSCSRRAADLVKHGVSVEDSHIGVEGKTHTP